MIELTDICKAYGENMVLDHFSCRLERGGVNCIMGASGKGKTTLLRILLELEQADSGQITGISRLRKSAVFQEDRLCEHLSAAGNVRLVCGKSVTQADILEAMRKLGLSAAYAEQAVRHMSGGEQRRVALLRALMAEYDILFLDEPFKGLDIETKDKAIRCTKERSQGKTVVFVTHDREECAAMDGRVIHME